MSDAPRVFVRGAPITIQIKDLDSEEEEGQHRSLSTTEKAPAAEEDDEKKTNDLGSESDEV